MTSLMAVPIHVHRGPACVVHVRNEIPGTRLVLWRKEYPHLPTVHHIQIKSTTFIPIPKVETPDSLLGTNLEIRIMRRHDHCVHRVMLWMQAGLLCVASPNDVERNIDDMGYDLSTTCRRIGVTNPNIHLRFLTCAGYLFVALSESAIIPLEYVF